MKQSVSKKSPVKKNVKTKKPKTSAGAGSPPPEGVSASARRRAPAGRKKRKKREKTGAKDKLRAVLVSALLVTVAVAVSLAVLHYHSRMDRKKAALTSEADRPASVEKAVPAQPAPAGDSPAAPAAETPATPPTQMPNMPAAKMPAAKEAPAEIPPVRPAAGNQPVPKNAPAAENKTPRTVPEQPVPVEQAPVAKLPSAKLPNAKLPNPVSRGALAFVIDDAGYNLRELEPFLKFPGPLTIAVLPGLPYSAEAARRIRAAGKEVFLHLPMESLGGQNPIPGAVRAGMDRNEVKSIVNRNLDEIWPVAGINNHEGSKATMDEDVMEAVLSVCRERGILFLDSRTTAETAAPRAAERLGMNIGERDVFVDNVQDRKSMTGYINTGLAKAEQNGKAIMIGHVWSADLAPLLAELYPDLSGRGYSFSTAGKLIGGKQQ